MMAHKMGQGEEKAKSLVVYYREGGGGMKSILRGVTVKKHPNNYVFFVFADLPQDDDTTLNNLILQ